MQDANLSDSTPAPIAEPVFETPTQMLFWREGRVIPVLSVWGLKGISLLNSQSFGSHFSQAERNAIETPESLRYIATDEVGTQKRYRIEFQDGRILGYTDLPPVPEDHPITFEDPEGDFEGHVRVGTAKIHAGYLATFLMSTHDGDLWCNGSRPVALVDHIWYTQPSEDHLESEARYDVYMGWTEIAQGIYIPDPGSLKTFTEQAFVDTVGEALFRLEDIQLTRTVEIHTGLDHD